MGLGPDSSDRDRKKGVRGGTGENEKVAVFFAEGSSSVWVGFRLVRFSLLLCLLLVPGFPEDRTYKVVAKGDFRRIEILGK